MSDIVNAPPHYKQYEIEPKEFIIRNKLTFEIGNVIKYAMRAGSKEYPNMTPEMSAITDLRKAIRYAEMRINLIMGQDKL